jgi:hypothetical protein
LGGAGHAKITYSTFVAGSCINPAAAEGHVIYNSTHHVLQYCNGAKWVAVGK